MVFVARAVFCFLRTMSRMVGALQSTVVNLHAFGAGLLSALEGAEGAEVAAYRPSSLYSPFPPPFLSSYLMVSTLVWTHLLEEGGAPFPFSLSFALALWSRWSPQWPS